MRVNFRIKIRNLTLFFMLSKTQTLRGIMSKTADNKHYLFFDLEKTDLQTVKTALRELQRKYSLSNIYICSDLPFSFRAFCFNKFDFQTYLHILTDSVLRKINDWNFIHWTIVRGQATLRISQKKDREKQKVVSILKSYHLPIPKNVNFVVYDTGMEKSGFNILLGEKKHDF